jgi:hypothetical protein
MYDPKGGKGMIAAGRVHGGVNHSYLLTPNRQTLDSIKYTIHPSILPRL